MGITEGPGDHLAGYLRLGRPLVDVLDVHPQGGLGLEPGVAGGALELLAAVVG